MSVRTTPFVQDAATGKRVTPWWLAYIIVFLVLILGVQSAVLAVFSQVWPVGRGTPEAQLQEMIGFAAAGIVLVLWVVLFERRKIRTLGFRRPGRGLVTLLVGFVAGLVLLSIPTLFLWATGAYVQVDPPAGANSGAGAAGLLVLLALTFVVQGGVEELLTRGFLLQNGGLKFPGWLAVLLPALLFTLIHGVLIHPLPFAMIFLFALMASFLVLRTGALWLVIGIHAGWNFTMGNIYGVPVSGLPPLTTSAIFLEPAADAPDWLTGGDFGTEASLPAVIVLLIAAAVAFIVYRRWDSRGDTELPSLTVAGTA
ncbi:CPBP family intramembrane glutamic endopeptidase [Microbacterium sp. NPDC058389]|uniref:CPBP family intramembrane glutamic endopeptidase n=1 Tax=Microbacterium sp. NPDC058389 TaxID=3346475 RepID=UPI0036564AFF